MSNWNQLEERVRSWTPRAPSPSVKERLFSGPLPHVRVASAASPGIAASEWNTRAAAWHWLAPAMAVFLLGVFVVGRNQTGFDSASMSWAVSAMGEPQLAAYSVATHHSDANSPPVTTIASTFGWTNEGRSLEAPAPMGQTNSPMQ